jgi:hypothetical protein
MKVNWALVLLVIVPGGLASSARATTIRTGSGYGQVSVLSQTDVATQWEVCLPNEGNDNDFCDLLIQIEATGPAPSDTPNPLLDQSILITLNNVVFSGADGFNSDQPLTAPVGLINCGSSDLGNLGPAGSIPGPCTGASENLDPSCVPSASSGNSFSVNGNCVIPGETFYFDIQPGAGTDSNGFPNDPDVTAATIGSASASNVAEPTSLWLLAMGLLPMAAFVRRRTRQQLP